MKNNNTQMIRCLLIFFVIIIHSIYESNIIIENYFLIVLRQICNIAVPLFFFISGYYTNIEKYKSKDYILKRLTNLIIPLLFWNLVYFFLYDYSIKTLFIFSSAAHLYFIVVLIQLVLLTPIIYKLKDNKMTYLITPLYLLTYRILLLKYNLDIPLHHYCIFAWIIYYQLGIKMKDNKTTKSYISIFFIGLIIEIIYSFQMYYYFDFNTSLSQMNIINMAVSISIFGFIIKIINSNNKVNSNIISRIGDNSLGIFYIHILVFKLIKYMLNYIIKDTLIIVITSSILTILLCYIIVLISKKIIPEKYLKYIGF